MVDGTLAEERREFYVYVIFRPNGIPCYIGKGRKGRWKQHFKGSHNKRLRRVFAQSGGDLPIVKVRERLTNVEACAAEIALIRAVGRQDIGTGPLVNFTDGGEGLLGHIPTPETRSKRSAALTGRKRPPEIGDAVRRASAWLRPEWKIKQRESHLGKNAPLEQRINQSAGQFRRHGKDPNSFKDPGAKLTTLQRMILGKPPMTKEEMADLTRQRNIGNKYGVGNKKTPEGQARCNAAVAKANALRVATPEYRELRRQIAKAMWAKRSAAEKAEWAERVRVATRK